MVKALAPAVLIALKEALSKIYWYKKDLENFIEYAVENSQIVASIDWSKNTKYEAVSILIDRMNRNNEIYFNDLLSLLHAVLEFNDFSHFDRLDNNDKDKHKRAAQNAVNALRAHCKGYLQKIVEAEATESAKKRFVRKQNQIRDYNNKIEEFKGRFYKISQLDAQKRGYELEIFLNDLFMFYDLLPRSSFRINGEQIDGAFTHDNYDYLLEAKWHSKPIERREIDIFASVIGRKLKSTLGLFISINGFVPTLNDLHYDSVILMDSLDLIQVLENRIQLPELLMRKRRHAAETGESMFHVTT